MGHTEEEDMLSKLLLEKKSSDIEHIHNKINTTRTALPKHLHKAWENDEKRMQCVLLLQPIVSLCLLVNCGSPIDFIAPLLK